MYLLLRRLQRINDHVQKGEEQEQQPPRVQCCAFESADCTSQVLLSLIVFCGNYRFMYMERAVYVLCAGSGPDLDGIYDEGQ